MRFSTSVWREDNVAQAAGFSGRQRDTNSGRPSSGDVRKRSGARSTWKRPLRSSKPTRNISASASIRPVPQTPNGGPPSIVVVETIGPCGRIRTLSIAPLVARMPHETEPPSKAGPAEAEQATRKSRLPRTTSPLVPMSSSNASSSGLVHAGGQDSGGDVAADVAADHGHGVEGAAGVDADAHLGGPQRRRAGDGGTKGETRIRSASSPSRKCSMAVLPAATTQWMSPRPISARSTRSSISVSMSWRMARWRVFGAAWLPGVVDAADDVGADTRFGSCTWRPLRG